ncbi:MAG: hypothetical protein FIB03_13840 [Anaerolineae bacterium]|nr:hypothetical protein [Anaerolineae bacterium]
MSKNLLIKFIGMATFIASCAAPTETPTPEAQVEASSPTEEVVVAPESGMPVMGEGLCANAYFPVREGATWTYTSTGSSHGDYSFTSTVSSTRADGFTLTGQFDEVTVNQEWACRPEGLVALQLGGGPAGSLTVQDMKLELETQNATGVTYPAEIKPGDSWSSGLDFQGKMNIADQLAEASGDAQSNYTAIGMESVIVPAGTFEAMKVQVEMTININASYQGLTVPVTFTGTSTTWLVQGVGWVKSESVSNFADTSITETIELQSYSIR